jgi:hypothetical protein|tara:strand:+ start:96 stop:704 length:609 start_codon:yes stop_codon:yes gene_type:complete
MGMFDEIIVPRSYLRNLLNKEDERLFKKDHVFQTKDLDNVMDLYKVHRRQLFRLNRSEIALKEGVQHTSLADQWDKVRDNIDINFHDHLKDRKGDEYSVEFEFTFKNGKVDKKKLISLNLEKTKAERELIDEMWDIEQEIFDDFRSTSLKYRFFSWLEGHLNKMTNWARKKHRLPIELRKMAYEKSGRLEKDPKSLNIYMDV